MAFCHDVEGWSTVSRVRDFDLTLCIQEGALQSGLLLCLLIGSLVYGFLWVNAPIRERTTRSLWALRVKITLLAAASIVSFANFALILSWNVAIPVLYTYLLEPTALACAAFVTYIAHTRTRVSSTLLLLFWPLYLLALCIWTRTMRLNGLTWTLRYLLALRWTCAGLGLSAFAIECLGPEFDRLPDKQCPESPVLTANIYSRWAFAWMTPLLQIGAKSYITEVNLPSLLPKDEAANLGMKLKLAMEKHPSSLWLALFRAYGGPYAVAIVLKIMQDCLAFLQPQLLRILLAFISAHQTLYKQQSAVQGFAIATLMFIASVAQTVTLNQYFQNCFETGMRVRSGLVCMIYNKALVVSNEERSRASGDIVNLMSVDATRLQDLCTYGLIAISGPFQITLAFVSLYNLLGWSAFVGVAIMIISIPLNTFVARILKRMQEQQMKNRDLRTRLMSELLANIKSIKLYAWEDAFKQRILHVRNDQELKMLRKIGIATALNTTLWSGIPLLVAFSSFAAAAVGMDKPLTADIIFPAISLFMLLQFPLAMFAQVTSNIIEAVVSVRRLSEFLNSSELQADARKVIINPNLRVGDPVLSIVGGEFWWSTEAGFPTLENINLVVEKGELIGVLGRVGAGKTSLISAIIGDMRRTDGEVYVFGTIAYAPQNPWILSSSVRENILFSHQYDENFYNLVIEACALVPDLALLPQGDLTEVGEKGITLSGGQRARISLARAVYARADLVLLDDVLSAVDSHVARHVFDHVIGPSGLLAGKARILVTNSIAFLKQLDRAVFIRRGIILEQGFPSDLISNADSEIGKLVRSHGTSLNSSGASTPFRGSNSGTATPSEPTPSSPVDSVALSEKLRRSRAGSFAKAALAPSPTPRSNTSGLSKEHTEQGRVKRTVYTQYIQAASRTGFAVFLAAIVLQQAMSVGANLMLRAWGEHNREMGSNRGMGRYLLAYGMFSLSSTLLGAVSAITIWVFCTVRSAKHLHDSMLSAVLRSPISFFELTPTGRILNLFSRDVYVVDQILVRVFGNLFRTLAVCLSILAVIGGSFPPFLFAVIPLGWFYSRVMKYYLSSSRELKRLDAVSRSPIFAWFSESLSGLATIRAFGQQQVFIANNENRIDRNQICYLPGISVNRWLAVRLEFVGACIILIVAVLALLALVTTGVDAGLVGLVLSYALNTTSSLNWVVRSASEVEQNIVSVERILHYIELPSEAPEHIPNSIPESWPSVGEVEFCNYSARYRPELDLVLKNISIKIKPREKIGICGRTGAGKSSFLLALFRTIEPAEGTILIDSIDISKIGLKDLRSAIAIVPQSPDLFEGTLRENIDPVAQYADADIWAALGQSHLKEYVESLPEALDTRVDEGGSSLSSGQRQLLCFARALLRKARILVLDEATSAVDLETDHAIQQIIRGPGFADVTILTIAHRLNTIMESDRVLVLNAGQVAEMDTPSNLLNNKTTMFYALASEAGLAPSE